jgi:hypothetical protein
MQTVGVSSHSYIAHVDPSSTGDNFALVVAHAELDETRQRHVVVDLIRAWRPADFADHRIDYEQIFGQVEELMCRFRLTHISFDQFNAAWLFSRLQTFARTDPRVLGSPSVFECTATHDYNHRAAETFKAALGRQLVHAPYDSLAEAELRNLELRNGRVDHPTRGPVQTNDVADCLMAVTYTLMGERHAGAIGEALSAAGVRGSAKPMDPVHEQLGKSYSGYGARGRGYDPSRSPHRPGRGRR